MRLGRLEAPTASTLPGRALVRRERTRRTGIEPDGANAGRARADDIRRPRVADHHGFRRHRPEPLERDLEDRRIRLGHAAPLPRRPARRRIWSSPHVLSLSCCSSSRLLETMAMRARARERRQQRRGARDRPRRTARYVSRYIAATAAASVVVLGAPTAAQQPAESLDRAPLQAARARASRRACSSSRNPACDAFAARRNGIARSNSCRLLHRRQRVAGAAVMVEQRVVEIEQDRLESSFGARHVIIAGRRTHRLPSDYRRTVVFNRARGCVIHCADARGRDCRH